MTPTATVRQVILSALLEGKWVETAYLVDDPRWKDALKVYSELKTAVKMSYKP